MNYGVSRKAVAWFSDAGMRKLLDEYKRHFQRNPNDQRELVGNMTPFYEGLMMKLARQQSKILWHIASYYGNPVPCSIIIRDSRFPRNVASSQLSRLTKSGIIKRTDRGYLITEEDFLRVYVVRWSSSSDKWGAWRDKQPKEIYNDIVDRFIEEKKQEKRMLLEKEMGMA